MALIATDHIDTAVSVAGEGSGAEQASSSTAIQRWIRFLQAPVDGASLSIFRICFAACMLVNQTVFGDKFILGIAAPSFHFSYIPGMPVPSEPQMQVLLLAMDVMAVLIGLGFLYRPACALFFMSYTYLFLCEKMLYQNHAYLSCLVAFWLLLAPAHRNFAVDNFKGRMPRTVPRWSVLIFKLQIAIVYFYAGITKLNPEWLRGQPQTAWLQGRAALPIIGPIVSQSWFVPIVTFGGIAVDLSMGFLLFAKRTFPMAAIAALSFHLLNSCLWQIDFFPWFMIATIGLFAPYDWPRKALYDIGARGKVTEPVSSNVETPSPDSSTSLWNGKATVALLVLFHAYLLVQLTVPLRRFFYPGDMNWTNQGHRFCWSMMARRATVYLFKMRAIDPHTHETQLIDNSEYLTDHQLQYMAMRPDMILQYSLFIAEKLEKSWGVRPIIHVKSVIQFNDHRPQLLINPHVDLASQKPSLAPATWILPLKD